jgi:hypothetical protein
VHLEVVPLHDLHGEADGRLCAVSQACEIALLMVPWLPHADKESLFVRIGHYEEVHIDLLMRRVMPQLDQRLSRHSSDETASQFRLVALGGNAKAPTDRDA